MQSRYITLSPDEKLELLKRHCFGAPFPTLDQRNWCLHCEKEFDGHSVRVWEDARGGHWLECGTPGCDGSPIDWAPYPWWDDDHPLTRQHDAEERRQEQEERERELKESEPGRN
jgi:hypothetical protein